MSKKRYHYDSKGRFRGYSSNQSPQSRNAKGLLIALPLIAIVSLCSRDSKDAEPAGDSEVSRQEVVAPSEVTNPSSSSPPEEPDVIVVKESATSATAESRPTVQPIMTREEYLDKTYVNRNTQCPRDGHEYNLSECYKGDTTACNFVKKCDPSFVLESPEGSND